jgi:hypothetical protein
MISLLTAEISDESVTKAFWFSIQRVFVLTWFVPDSYIVRISLGYRWDSLTNET